MELRDKMGRQYQSGVKFTDKGLNFIKNNIKGLLHFTSIENFKNIVRDGYIKSKSLLDPFDPNRKYMHELYPCIVYVSFWLRSKSIQKSTQETPSCHTENQIGLIVDVNIFFEDTFFYINPQGEYGLIDSDTIPNQTSKR